MRSSLVGGGECVEERRGGGEGCAAAGGGRAMGGAFMKWCGAMVRKRGFGVWAVGGGGGRSLSSRRRGRWAATRDCRLGQREVSLSLGGGESENPKPKARALGAQQRAFGPRTTEVGRPEGFDGTPRRGRGGRGLGGRALGAIQVSTPPKGGGEGEKRETGEKLCLPFRARLAFCNGALALEGGYASGEMIVAVCVGVRKKFLGVGVKESGRARAGGVGRRRREKQRPPLLVQVGAPRQGLVDVWLRTPLSRWRGRGEHAGVTSGPLITDAWGVGGAGARTCHRR